MVEEQKYTKFEIARILGARALQLSMNAPILIKISKEELEKIKFDPLSIAEIEFKGGVLPITVRRPFPKKEFIELKEKEEEQEKIIEELEEKVEEEKKEEKAEEKKKVEEKKVDKKAEKKKEEKAEEKPEEAEALKEVTEEKGEEKTEVVAELKEVTEEMEESDEREEEEPMTTEEGI